MLIFAVPELDSLKYISETWIEDVAAPDWLRLQHPGVRFLWEKSFKEDYGIAEVAQAMGINSSWKMSKSKLSAIQESIENPNNLNLMLQWIDANFRQANLANGYYGGIEGTLKAPVIHPFESQLKFFIFHSLWLPVRPLVLRSSPQDVSSAAKKGSPMGLLYHSGHSLTEIVGHCPDADRLLCLDSSQQLDRRTAHELGMLADVVPQSALIT